MNYKNACVVDEKGNYLTLVLVILEPDEHNAVRENIQYYTLRTGERLVDAAAPSGIVKPRWNGKQWEESTTPEGIE